MAAYDAVRDFEATIASWTGAPYAVAVESCTMAIFLCLKYINGVFPVQIPKFTYPGVANSIIHAGYKIHFMPYQWEGVYHLFPYNVVDCALRFRKGMYDPGSLQCLSFHYKKLLPIERGGMILTDDKDAVDWLKMARFDGRKEGVPLNEDNATICGWNAYMTPEQASRGLALFEVIKDKDLPDLKVAEQSYPDLSTWRCFK